MGLGLGVVGEVEGVGDVDTVPLRDLEGLEPLLMEDVEEGVGEGVMVGKGVGVWGVRGMAVCVRGLA